MEKERKERMWRMNAKKELGQRRGNNLWRKVDKECGKRMQINVEQKHLTGIMLLHTPNHSFKTCGNKEA